MPCPSLQGRSIRPSATGTLRRPRVIQTIIALALLLLTPGIALSAPRPAPSTARSAAVALGGGTYDVEASVFGTSDDGLIGNETSSGHILGTFDRLVALPACTESSCPWVPLGTGVEGKYGPQTSCAEGDGLCWVQVVSLDTGGCAVAPVLDTGPLFVHDNWWAPRRQRAYQLDQGIPAAEAARDGADLGYGPGISDRGYDIAHVYSYAAGIDLAAGTWSDLGLDVAQGIGAVRVTMLWQAGINHLDACAGAGYGNARTTDDLNLRDSPSWDAGVRTVMPAGSRVAVTGGRAGDFYPIAYDGLTGWAFGGYLRPNGGGSGDPMAVTTESLRLRAGPSFDDATVLVMPAGSLVVPTGRSANSFLAVSYQGTDGWSLARYLDTGSAAAGTGFTSTTAITTDRLNLRTGPSADAAVLFVMPTGAHVRLTGDRQNGFLSIRYRGTSGWAAAAYLAATATVTENLNLRSGPSTADDVLRVLPAGAVVTLTGDSRNGFVPVSYRGDNGWVYAAYLT